MVFKFDTVASNICGSSIQNFFHVSFLTARILRWFLYFLYICSSLALLVRKFVHTLAVGYITFST